MDVTGQSVIREERRHYLLFAGVMVVLGFLLVTAMRTAPLAVAGLTTGDSQEELIQVVQELESRRDSLKSTLGVLRLETASLGARSATSGGLLDEYSARIRSLSVAAGLVAVRGPGLEVYLADNPQPPEGSPIDLAIVHDYDLRGVVNALWAGGADAIAVNGERFTYFTAIRCVGATVLINNTRVAPPFRVPAIGDATSLSFALQNDADTSALMSEYARRYGLIVKIEKKDELVLPAYEGVPAYTALVPEEEKQ